MKLNSLALKQKNLINKLKQRKHRLEMRSLKRIKKRNWQIKPLKLLRNNNNKLKKRWQRKIRQNMK